MSLGSQTVGFVTVTRSGDPGYLGLKAQSRTTVSISGCHFRPVSVAETAENSAYDIATEIWRLTAPPEAAAIAAASTGELTYGSSTFQMTGPAMPKYDLTNTTVDHVTIMAKRQA